MKRSFRKTVSVLLAAAILLGTAPLAGLTGIELPDWSSIFSAKAEAAEAVTSGTCGDNLTWNFDESTGTLTISGTGEMYNWLDSSSAPWYSLRSEIKKVTILQGITSINSMAFHYYPLLTSIIVDSANSAYSNDDFGVLFNKDKTELIKYPIGNTRTSYDIPDSVKTLSNKAFEFSANLTTISIPDSVTSIYDHTFNDCTGLTSIEVDSANTAYSSDESGVLFNKNKTKLIRYPVGNTRTSYAIPDSVTIIGDCAFDSCDSLTSVEIPNSVTSINSYAFASCNSLTSVEIPNSVTNIGPNCAFYDCDNLTSITVDSSNTAYSSDETGVLFNKDKTNLIQYPNGKTATNYDIPNSVISIGNWAFYSCDNLESIEIPDSVTSIGKRAFLNCTGLTNVIIPNSITEVGIEAFRFCSSLKSVIIPVSLTSLSEMMFHYCTGLTSITIPDSVTSIDTKAFLACTNLADVYYTGTEEEWNAVTIAEKNAPLLNATIHFNYVPGEVTASGKCGDNLYWEFYESTGEIIFSGTGAIPSYSNHTLIPWYEYHDVTKRICLNDGVTGVGSNAFTHFYKVVTIILPKTVTYIGTRAFYIGDNLRHIIVSPESEFFMTDNHGVLFDKNQTVLILVPARYPKNNVYSLDYSVPYSVKRIEPYAFSSNHYIKNISISINVSEIGENAFGFMYRLEQINVSSGNQFFSSDDSGVLFDKNKTVLIRYPQASSKTIYEIPDTVATIADHAFKGTQSYLKEVIIPDRVTSIGEYAFDCCRKLTSITIPESVTTIKTGAFRECLMLKEIYLPDSITNIERYTFAECLSLKEIILPKNIETIGTDTFLGCENLEYINIPQNVKEIGLTAFKNCSSLKYVHIPSSTNKISESAFDNTTAYICSTRDDIYAKEYADRMGIEFRACDGHGEYLPEYLVTWNVDGVETKEFYDYGETITAPENPAAKTGYTFSGWDGYTNGMTMPANDVTFTAIYTPNTYNAIFWLDDAKTQMYETVPVAYGEEIPFPEAPEVPGKEFIDWDNAETVMGAGDMEFVAMFNDIEYFIEFYDDEGIIICEWVAFYGDEIDVEDLPALIKEGHDFLGWYVNGERAEFPYTVTEDTMFEAVFVRQVYDVICYVDGYEYTRIPHEFGSVIELYEYPVKEGYTFSGWDREVPATMPAEDVILNAEWVVNSYELVYRANGGTFPDGSDTKEFMIPYGTAKADWDIPEMPVKTGYTFIGWNMETVPATMPANPVNVVAQWEINTYTVTWVVDGVVTEETYEYGAEIKKPADPVKQGYVFNGWSPEVPATQGTEDATYTATWANATDTPYTVETYFMGLDGAYGEPSTEIRYGETDSTVSVTPAENTGFSIDAENSVLSGTVAADGSLVLKIFYSRNKNTVNINGKPGEYYYGEEIPEPENPTPPEGYEQDGWVDEDGNIVTFPIKADENTPAVIKPNFVKKSYTLTWKSDDKIIKTETVEYDAVIVKHTALTKEGYTFNGWSGYTDGMTMPAKNVTITAKWTVNSYTVTWNVDGKETKTTVKFGEKVVNPADPVKAEYKFMGWTPAVPDKMPAKNLTFTAVFEKCYICPDCGKEILGEDAINKHIESETKVDINNGTTVGEIKPGATITIVAGQIDGKIFSHWVVEGAIVEDAYSAETTVTLGTGKITITAEYDDCECKCHKDGIAGFFFRIVLFFQKLFGNNLVCICGAKH